MAVDALSDLEAAFETYFQPIAEDFVQKAADKIMSKLIADLFPIDDPSLEIRTISKVATMLQEKPSPEQVIRDTIADSYKRKLGKHEYDRSTVTNSVDVGHSTGHAWEWKESPGRAYISLSAGAERCGFGPIYPIGGRNLR
jgi:hypothetical protein